jgi:hypothetical protein
MPETRDDRQIGRDSIIMHTIASVHFNGPGGAVVEVGGESPGLKESVRRTSVVEETAGREGKNS